MFGCPVEFIQTDERLSAGQAMPDQPAANRHTGAPDAAPTMQVDFATGRQGGIQGIQEHRHLFMRWQAFILDIDALVIDGNAIMGGFFLQDGQVGWQFARPGEVEECIETGLQESCQALTGNRLIQRWRSDIRRPENILERPSTIRGWVYRS